MGTEKKGLDRTTLKIIAIISMVIDHTAWGFVDFYSPLGQFMHVCGRLTVPIMCFFIAEGFRHTKDLRAYIGRMATFAVASVIPFYLFFHEEYDFRQNIIFDLLLALLVLTTLESDLKTLPKALITVLLFVVSAVIGGWIIMPILFVLIFYYGKDFKQKAIWFCAADVTLVLFTMVLITLNSRYHFMKYEWLWWDKSYLLGFMLALPLLAKYNGKKGSNFGGRYFFYLFYPCHFLVLWAIKSIINTGSAYSIYFGIHVFALLIVFILLFLTVTSRPSKGQIAIFLFEFAAAVYVFGFLLEILATTVEGYHLAILVEYFGEVFVMLGFLYYTQTLFKIRIPSVIYMLQTVIAVLIMYSLFTTRKNHFFYREIIADNTGEIPKLILDYGPGFYLAIGYIALVCVFQFVLCMKNVNNPQKVMRMRARLTIASTCFLWLPYIVKSLGLTGGYEIPGIGIMFASVSFYLVLFHYGVLDSATIAADNVFENSRDGIIVADTGFRFQMDNAAGRRIFGSFKNTEDVRNNPLVAGIVSGSLKTHEINGRIYEFSIEKLTENGFEQGLMLRATDATDRIRLLQEMRERAIKDAMTGLYNRNHFARELNAFLNAGGQGCFIMADMDDFKHVNDSLGHQAGDEVLIAFAEVLKTFEDRDVISGRLGGDEYVAFLKNRTGEDEISAMLKEITADFQSKLSEKGYSGCTYITIGAVICGKDMQISREFASIYNMADDVLYEAKQAGKNRFILKKA